MEPLTPDRYYHIYNRANGNDLIFTEDQNYQFFLEKYILYISPIADTLAYCCMPNHFHLLVRIKSRQEMLGNINLHTLIKNHDTIITEDELSKWFSKQFSNFFSSYAQAYNKLYHRKGSLFMKNYKRKIITDKTYFLRLVNYIHRNPVNHNFVHKPNEWKYSSYNAIVSNSTTLVKRDEVLDWFSGLDNFISNHLQSLDI